MKRICIDPGHGMSNRKQGVYDSGAEGGKITEAAIVMDWANELKAIIEGHGHKVVRTRIDAKDHAPVGQRADVARRLGCDIFLSLHCNASDGSAQGTETFYRGADNKAFAASVNTATINALGTRDRGIKTEEASQHTRLAVLNFPRAALLEIGFIDHPRDRAAMLDPVKRKAACEAIAKILTV